MNEIDDIFKDAAQSEQATFKPEYWDQYAEQFNAGEKKIRKGVFGFFLVELLFVSCIFFIAFSSSLDTETIDLAVNNSMTEKKKTKQKLDKTILKSNELPLIAVAKNNRLEVNAKVYNKAINNSYPGENSIKEELNMGEETKKELPSSVSTALNNETLASTKLFQPSPVSNRSRREILDFNKQPRTHFLLEKENEEEDQEQDSSTEKKGETKVKVIQIDRESSRSASILVEAVENIENKDSTTNSVSKPAKKSSFVTRNRMKKFQFNFQFGVIVYNDFSLSQAKNDINTGLFAGVEVEYVLKPNLTISLGLNGYNRSSDGLYIDFNYADNGFGEVNSKKTYSYTNLYFFEVPVNLNYVINSKHKIGAGPIFTRLLTTKVNVNKEIKGTQSTSNLRSNSNEYLYHYNTFKLNNVGINFTYQFLFKRVGFNIGYTHGLNEFLNKNTFNSSQYNSLNKLNLSIKYKW